MQCPQFMGDIGLDRQSLGRLVCLRIENQPCRFPSILVIRCHCTQQPHPPGRVSPSRKKVRENMQAERRYRTKPKSVPSSKESANGPGKRVGQTDRYVLNSRRTSEYELDVIKVFEGQGSGTLLGGRHDLNMAPNVGLLRRATSIQFPTELLPSRDEAKDLAMMMEKSLGRA